MKYVTVIVEIYLLKFRKLVTFKSFALPLLGMINESFIKVISLSLHTNPLCQSASAAIVSHCLILTWKREWKEREFCTVVVVVLVVIVKKKKGRTACTLCARDLIRPRADTWVHWPRGIIATKTKWNCLVQCSYPPVLYIYIHV